MIDRRFRSLSPLNMGYQVADAQHGRIVSPTHKRRSKVAILGGGAITRHVAPMEDPTWEVWSLNNLWPKDRDDRMRADRWFELHPMDVQNADDMGIINSCPVPLYVLELYPEVTNPMAVVFPLEDVRRGFEFFPCTFCYQIALAIAEGFETIGLYGVDLFDGSAREMALERAGVAFWIGLALGHGVHVEIPVAKNHGLITLPYRYGYAYHEEKKWVEDWLDTIPGYMDPATQAKLAELFEAAK